MAQFASSDFLFRSALPVGDVKPMAVEIEPATLSDLDAVVQLLTDSFHQFQSWNAWLSPLLVRGIHSDLQHRFSTTPTPYTCLLAYVRSESARTLVGTIEISRPTLYFQGQPYLYLSNLAVSIDYRRRGIGKQLLMTCESMAHDMDYEGLYLHVLKQNQAAQRLYASLGFMARSQFTWQGLNLTLPSRRQLLAKVI
jgi:ribosomal protein S18 acetylase RimI-like enzyme